MSTIHLVHPRAQGFLIAVGVAACYLAHTRAEIRI